MAHLELGALVGQQRDQLGILDYLLLELLRDQVVVGFGRDGIVIVIIVDTVQIIVVAVAAALVGLLQLQSLLLALLLQLILKMTHPLLQLFIPESQAVHFLL